MSSLLERRMKSLALAASMVLCCGLPTIGTAQSAQPAQADAARATTGSAAPRFGFGRPATTDEIAAWDVDVRPDGHGVKPGRGSVDRGQVVYDQQCASCHGTFGESNTFLALAGGVAAQDLKTGRASRLRDAEVQRTLGTKLNHATTLYDYIYRSMPWTNPMSLSVDDTYAVTAYVLHLNDIVPADFVLTDRNILTVPMPNRHGMTTAHGMVSVRGKPDVQGSLCMKDCLKEVKVTSELPAFAFNAHGNLAEQFRPLGAKGAIDTRRFDTSAAAGGSAAPVAAATVASSGGQRATQLLTKNGCINCHHATNRVVGPSYQEIAGKHGKRADGEAYLVKKMKEGGMGDWGPSMMPPQLTLSDDDARELARWMMTGAQP